MSARKNILLISLDDGNAFWRFRKVFGEQLQTPNLDRLFGMATAFTAASCQVPICGPSRASMLSGLSPYQSGILDNYTALLDTLRPDQLWQFRLRQAGYYCSTAGKVHHGFGPLPPRQHSALYSHPAHPLVIGPPRGRTIPVQKFGGLAGGPATTDLDHDALYYDSQSADDTISFLQNYTGDAPFYREAGFLHPHLPYKTPLRFKEMYDAAAFHPPNSWAKGFDLASFPQGYIEENFPNEDLEHWQKSVRNYFSTYSHVDYHVGRLLKAFEASPHAANTVLILFADHGYHLGDKNRFRKSTLYEESLQVPLLVLDPDHPGRQIDDPVGLIDIGPTVLDYAGCPAMADSPGRSLRPAVVSGKADPERGVLSCKFSAVSMRKGRWRVTSYPDGSAEMQDVEADPWLTENLAFRHPDFESLMDDLTGLAAEWGCDPGQTGLARLPGRFYRPLPDAPPPTGPPRAVFSTDRCPASAAGPAHIGGDEYITGFAKEGTILLGPATRRVRRGSDGTGAVERLRLVGNGRDNDFSITNSLTRLTLDVETGPGRNRVYASHERLEVRCGLGQTDAVTGRGGGVLQAGGGGPDRLSAGGGETILRGGAGPCTLIARSGTVQLESGAGPAQIMILDGDCDAVLGGGPARVLLKGGTARIRLRRTAQPALIEAGILPEEIDVSDWAGLGAVRANIREGRVVLTAGTERLTVETSDPDALLERIRGVAIEKGQDDRAG